MGRQLDGFTKDLERLKDLIALFIDREVQISSVVLPNSDGAPSEFPRAEDGPGGKFELFRREEIGSVSPACDIDAAGIGAELHLVEQGLADGERDLSRVDDQAAVGSLSRGGGCKGISKTAVLEDSQDIAVRRRSGVIEHQGEASGVDDRESVGCRVRWGRARRGEGVESSLKENVRGVEGDV